MKKLAGLTLVAFACAPRSPAVEPDVPRVKGLFGSGDSSLARACTPTGLELCFNATDDNCNGIIDEGCGVPTGLVQFAIAWDAPTADVDLNVTDPNGQLVEVGHVTRSGMVKTRDCPGGHDDCRGQNLENVYLEEGEALRGTYRVKIRLEATGIETPPIEVRFGARVGPKTYASRLSLEKADTEAELTFEL